jgi:tetratricopeptide (TPR) repeat protein
MRLSSPMLSPSFVRRALLALAAGAAAATAVGQEPAPAPVPTPITAGPVTSPGNAKWAATPDEAKVRAAAENKLVFIQFDREGRVCGLCRRMEGLLYPAMDFEALLLSMVPVKVQMDSPEGRELALRYRVHEVPAVVVTTPEGRVVFFMEGFLNTPDFYQHIYSDLKSYREFARRVDGQDIAQLPAKEALQTGIELYQRQDSASALPRLRRAIAARDATAQIRDDARELLAAVELDLGEPAAARQTADRLIAGTKDAARRERAELFRAQIPLAENNPAEALRLFRKFQKEHPNSASHAKVDEMIQKLAAAEPSS